MDIEKYLSRESFYGKEFEEMVNDIGLRNLKKSDLDKIVEKFGFEVFGIRDFADLYKIVSSDATNRTMSRWTIAIGVMTLIMMICTMVNMF